MASWQEAILRHAIDPMQQFAYVKGKNATDIALVIEAMDLLHSGEYDGFCLVSSDSDFASLAVRIRKSGLKAYGFGKKEAVLSFRQACDEFFEVESLKDNSVTTTIIDKWDNKRLKQDTKLINRLQEVLRDTKRADDEWSSYAQVVGLLKQDKSFDVLKYGYEKPIQLFSAIDLFSISKDKEKGTILIKSKQPLPPKKYTTKELQKEKFVIEAINKLIDTNPKSDHGWCSISYIASELNKNPNINLDKYGYKKFSELIAAIRLFDIKKEQKGIFIKNKHQKPIQSVNPKTMAPNSHQSNQSLLSGDIDIFVYAPSQCDVVLWRLGDNKKVRHDGDMIFYGQTHSADGLIDLDINDVFGCFSCKLNAQDISIHRMVLTISHENGYIGQSSPMHVVIEQAGQKIFTMDYPILDTDVKSMMFLELLRENLHWKAITHQQKVKQDLRQLCQIFGVEVCDE